MKATNNNNQKIPNSWHEREILRDKGQFWTPNWIAEAMASYVLLDNGEQIFDPGVGTGAFFRAAKKVANEKNKTVKFFGTEVDPEILKQAVTEGLAKQDLKNVQITDFLLNPPTNQFKAIVANPPYIRHHRLSIEVKSKLRELSARIIGKPLDGRTGYHVYFLIQALKLLQKNGKLAFIMPADTCEGVFASTLWDWISKHYCLEAVITFSPKASPFPKLDTNPIIFLIKNARPDKKIFWVKCMEAGTSELKTWINSRFEWQNSDVLQIKNEELYKAVQTGLSREPRENCFHDVVLGEFVKVVRGIATGDNEFFFLTKDGAKDLNLPNEFLLPAIGRTRDVNGTEEITAETFKNLELSGKKTRLLSLDGRSIEKFPEVIQDYLKRGEKMNIHRRTLIATRNPWYKMEVRSVPKFLFSYLGRRNSRFILNSFGIVPLTGFLCVYPKQNTKEFIEKLWYVLRRPETINNLSLVGKSYGSGAIKVEPRALERLPLPFEIVKEIGLL